LPVSIDPHQGTPVIEPAPERHVREETVDRESEVHPTTTLGGDTSEDGNRIADSREPVDIERHGPKHTFQSVHQVTRRRIMGTATWHESRVLVGIEIQHGELNVLGPETNASVRHLTTWATEVNRVHDRVATR
jgi:hypothetical protein